jgi:glutaredoxin
MRKIWENGFQGEERDLSMALVELYSRTGCHLCEIAKAEIESLRNELSLEHRFDLKEIFIDGDPKLEAEYGIMVPVILINGKIHGFGRVERDRMRAALINLS